MQSSISILALLYVWAILCCSYWLPPPPTSPSLQNPLLLTTCLPHLLSCPMCSTTPTHLKISSSLLMKAFLLPWPMPAYAHVHIYTYMHISKLKSSAHRREIVVIVFPQLVIMWNVMISSECNDFSFLDGWVKFHLVFVPCFLYSFIWWASELIPFLTENRSSRISVVC